MRYCNLSECPSLCQWSEWSCWGECGATCGIGQRTRSRNCTSPPDEACDVTECGGMRFSYEECDARCCPQDGDWSGWGEWSDCSATCGCDGYRSRSRSCSDPSPRCGGSSCIGSGVDRRACNKEPCPLDGGWSEWGCWSTCTASCGAGTQTQRRKCTNPASAFGGVDCVGADNTTRACNPGDCAVDGVWNEWSEWASCSRTCGSEGHTYRRRRCEYPVIANGDGAGCEGQTEEGKRCNRKNCPRDGEWAAWSHWGDCESTCGRAMKRRNRTCTNPAPSDGGADCTGSDSDFDYCLITECPVDGEWTGWTSWTECNRPCGGGLTRRARQCADPEPAFGGNFCAGRASESRDCNAQPCACDGYWSEWFGDGCCSTQCGIEGRRRMVRYCNSPEPENGGRICLGASDRTISCSRLHHCPIDGSWGQWGGWSVCSKTCGRDGRRTRERECNSPEPQRDGLECIGAAVENQHCNITPYCPCEGGWSRWSSWSTCTGAIGGPKHLSHRTCTNPTPNNTQSTCPGDRERTKGCVFHVAAHGRWCEWTLWSSCSVTCEEGVRVRIRECACPPAAGGGRECLGTNEEEEVCILPHCPIDGGWSNWNCWGACSVSCGTIGFRFRSRTCTNPAPQNGGSPCPGPGSNREGDTCLPEIYCPPERRWSGWDEWSGCGRTCGTHVTRKRTRVCVAYGLTHTGGDYCKGSAAEIRSCNLDECPCDGGYSVWSQWDACSVTCGSGGKRTRTRHCTNPPPSNNGYSCTDQPASESQNCTSDVCCAIDGSWSSFGAFSSCSRDCFTGIRVSLRYCNDSQPQCGGRECEGPNAKVESCNEQPCPCNGGWSLWSVWSQCDRTCGNGTKTRRRSCDNPVPVNGMDCEGASEDQTECLVTKCLVDCEWSHWNEWNPCNKPCGLDATQQRKRLCVCPVVNSQGLNCQGADTEPRTCDLPLCPCDGEWSDWGQWSQCSITCRNSSNIQATRSRKRTCTNPSPTDGGNDCGSDPTGLNNTERATCEHLYHCPIDGSWGQWRSFGACSRTCGVGVSRKERNCDRPSPANRGAYCAGKSVQLLTCNNQSCPCDGGFGPWGPWSGCSVSCGSGTKHRARACVAPVPSNAGKECDESNAFQTVECYQPFQCPRDGSWTQWSAWSLCSVFCGHGIRQRFRTCQNPGFANHYMEGQQLPGRNCPGKSHDIQTCHQECISDSAVRCCEPRPLIDGSFSVLHVTVLKAAEVGYSVGTEIVYECDGDIPGLTLKLTGPRTRRCTSDGNWSGEDPYCVVTTELTSHRFRRLTGGATGRRARRNAPSFLGRVSREVRRSRNNSDKQDVDY
ncbi:A disintegrin and metalloproteinase with thrombospondin motifs adt-1-like [Corticium candelabrum]|uniref:A disintegrin and metalloproteinase with thrombospondin motifs adt-1-like n=1 Tax=Corticium candelabrum TaxID=121492 RepID=UPI002E262EF6|nr:A disintegrin and metalloproteinase with thrombospondin motifs adt-1-like [Corticium candelabrum]